MARFLEASSLLRSIKMRERKSEICGIVFAVISSWDDVVNVDFVKGEINRPFGDEAPTPLLLPKLRLQFFSVFLSQATQIK